MPVIERPAEGKKNVLDDEYLRQTLPYDPTDLHKILLLISGFETQKSDSLKPKKGRITAVIKHKERHNYTDELERPMKASSEALGKLDNAQFFSIFQVWRLSFQNKL